MHMRIQPGLSHLRCAHVYDSTIVEAEFLCGDEEGRNRKKRRNRRRKRERKGKESSLSSSPTHLATIDLFSAPWEWI